jgi:DNA-binding transcriptional MocR family regulator
MSSLELVLSPEAHEPVYRQIADGIRASIESGQLGAGARLPAIRNLASQLEVNRDTVALAYDALSSEGWVESTVGRGTFVRSLGAQAEGLAAPLELASQVERLLDIDDARTRFGDASDAAAMHTLIPDPALYPVGDFRRAFNRAVGQGGPELFLYGSAQGHAGLREVLSDRFVAAGMEVAASEIVLCHGASQGIALALRLFASAGDYVAVEEPTYHNVLATLASIGMRPIVVPMTHDGPDLDVLARVLARPEVKAFYTIPTFHNPMGITTSLAHRRALVDVAARAGKPIIEDAFEMDLRCSGRSVPPLSALDRHGLVVHLYSFSKSLFPGLRVGAIAARGRAVDGLVALKQATDLSDSMPMQAAVAEFISGGAYERHLGRIRRELRLRHEAIREALETWLPEGTRFTKPEGGYQVWVELPLEIDTRDLLTDAARAGVLFAPGSKFLPEGGPSAALRLTIAQVGSEQIHRAIRALGEVLQSRVGARQEVRQPASVHQ